MKVNYEQAIKVINYLKLNVDEQQDDIKHLKEQFDIYNRDAVQKIIEPDARTLIKNRPLWLTCNQTFAMKNVLKKHIQEEPTELL